MRAGSVGSYVVGAFAGIAAIAVCIGVAILANQPDVIRAFSLPGWLPGLVSVAAMLVVAMVAVVAAFALVPRRWH